MTGPVLNIMDICSVVHLGYGFEEILSYLVGIFKSKERQHLNWRFVSLCRPFSPERDFRFLILM